MPKVGKRHFKYTKSGKAAAKQYAKKLRNEGKLPKKVTRQVKDISPVLARYKKMLDDWEKQGKAAGKPKPKKPTEPTKFISFPKQQRTDSSTTYDALRRALREKKFKSSKTDPGWMKKHTGSRPVGTFFPTPGGVRGGWKKLADKFGLDKLKKALRQRKLNKGRKALDKWHKKVMSNPDPTAGDIQASEVARKRLEKLGITAHDVHKNEGVRGVHWHGGGPGRPSDHPGRFKEPTPEQLRKAKERAEKAGEGLVRNPDGSLVYRKLKPGEKSISGRVGK